MGAQIFFVIAGLVFTVYSLVGVYALNTYGRSSSVTTTLSILYSGAAVGLMVWGWVAISNLQ